MAWRSTRRFNERAVKFDFHTGLNKAAVLQVDARGAVNVRRWDAGEDDRAQGALAARVRGALWRHRSRSVWKSTSELVYARNLISTQVPLAGRARGVLFHLGRGQGY